MSRLTREDIKVLKSMQTSKNVGKMENIRHQFHALLNLIEGMLRHKSLNELNKFNHDLNGYFSSDFMTYGIRYHFFVIEFFFQLIFLNISIHIPIASMRSTDFPCSLDLLRKKKRLTEAKKLC